MWKLFVVLAILAWTLPVFGADANLDTDVMISAVSQGSSELTVNSGDVFTIDLFASSPSGKGFLVDTGRVIVSIDGDASFCGNRNFTYSNCNWTTGSFICNYEYINSKTLAIQAGYLGLPDESMYVGLSGVVIGNIGVQCDGLGDVVISAATSNEANPWGRVVYANDGVSVPAIDDESAGGSMNVIQVPEPGTIFLLGLSLVFVRARRKS